MGPNATWTLLAGLSDELVVRLPLTSTRHAIFKIDGYNKALRI